jgi:methylphosphotriester-DNA--protein-cysteine methyltransferase
MSSEEQIHEAYRPCRQCLSMDSILQEDIVEEKKDKYLMNLAGLYSEKVLDKSEFDELVGNCYDCIASRKKQSEISKSLRPSLESIKLKDPFKEAI